MYKRLWPLLWLVLTVPVFAAAIDVYEFENLQQEEQFKDLTEKLRCLVCQNQNIADSNAELAKDLRDEVYKMILQGQMDDEIVSFLTARYGNFVIFDPPVNGETLVLWAGPFVLIIGGVVVLIVFIRRRMAGQVALEALSSADRARLDALLGGENEEGSA